MSGSQAYPDPNTAQNSESGPYRNNPQTQRLQHQVESDLISNMPRDTLLQQELTSYANNREVNQPDQNFSSQMYSQPNIPQSAYSQLQASQMLVPGSTNNVESAAQDPSAARKKPKVSRACDECRRTKQRCDADSDNPEHAKCTRCARVQATCQFSRVPMKRGPSKGYIRDMGDSVDSIKGTVEELKAEIRDLKGQGGASPYEQSPVNGQSLKRTYSISEMGGNASWSPSNLNGPGQAPFAPMMSDQTSHVTPASSVATVGPRAIPFDMSQAQAIEPAMEGAVTPHQERLLDEYYRVIHPTFPLLPEEKSMAVELSSRSSFAGRDGLFQSLYLVVSSSASVTDLEEPALDGEPILNDILNAERIMSTPRNFVQLLVKLQTAILMMMAIDMSGPIQPNKGKRSRWFAVAFGVAQDLKLPWNSNINPRGLANAEPLWTTACRAWWVLVVLDRFYAAGSGIAAQIPDQLVNLVPNDVCYQGFQFHHICNSSHLLTYMFDCIEGPGRFSNNLLKHSLYSFHFLVSHVDISIPVINPVYWHLKLLAERIMSIVPGPRTENNIVAAAKTLARVLQSDVYPATPLTFHFVTLTAKTLMDFIDVPEWREDCAEGLKHLLAAIEYRQVLDTTDLEKDYWRKSIYDAISKKMDGLKEPMDSANLQHLADAAFLKADGVTTDAEKPAFVGNTIIESVAKLTKAEFDWSNAARDGYLNFFT